MIICLQEMNTETMCPLTERLRKPLPEFLTAFDLIPSSNSLHLLP